MLRDHTGSPARRKGRAEQDMQLKEAVNVQAAFHFPGWFVGLQQCFIILHRLPVRGRSDDAIGSSKKRGRIFVTWVALGAASED